MTKAKISKSDSRWNITFGEKSSAFFVYGLDSFDDAIRVFDCYRNNFIASFLISSATQQRNIH